MEARGIVARTPYELGDWFALPTDDKWIVGRVARMDGHNTIYAYFFPPLRDDPPEAASLASQSAGDAFTQARFSDLESDEVSGASSDTPTSSTPRSGPWSSSSVSSNHPEWNRDSSPSAGPTKTQTLRPSRAVLTLPKPALDPGPAYTEQRPS